MILSKNEEKNIADAILSSKQISSRILVMDCGSSDNTQSIAESLGAEVVIHEWPGHAKQFNWALDNCNITTPWVFRLDADERVSEELAQDILAKIQSTTANGLSMKLRLYFMGKWIKHGGTHKIEYLRLFRNGTGRSEEKLMDEHIAVDGKVELLHGDLIHYDYKGLDAWLNKHIWYSNLELQISDQYKEKKETANSSRRSFYYRLPMFFRAKMYYLYRYYFQLGFLDGKEGKIFAFLQAYWFRFLVDAKLYEREKDTSQHSDTIKPKE